MRLQCTMVHPRDAREFTSVLAVFVSLDSFLAGSILAASAPASSASFFSAGVRGVVASDFGLSFAASISGFTCDTTSACSLSVFARAASACSPPAAVEPLAARASSAYLPAPAETCTGFRDRGQGWLGE